MEQEFLDLNASISKEEAGITGYFSEEPDNIFTTVLDAQAKTKESSKVDTTDYSTDNPHLIMDTRPMLKVLSQLSSVLSLNASRSVFRGVTLEILNTDAERRIKVISPGEVYYFTSELEGDTDLDVGTTIYLDYSFMQKIAKFLPQKILIFKSTEDGIDRYYLRLTTGDLELLNPTLIESDLKQLKSPAELNTLLASIEPAPLLASLQTLSKIITSEADSKRRFVISSNNSLTFSTTLVAAKSKSDMIDMLLPKMVVDYLMKTLPLISNGSKLEVYATNSGPYNRIAFVSDNTLLITTLSDGKPDSRVEEWFKSIPDTTPIDLSDLKYQVDYAKAITYTYGVLDVTVENGKFIGKIPLSTGGASDLHINTNGVVNLPNDTKFRLNISALSSIVNALDLSLPTEIGFKDGLLFFVNPALSMLIVTM